MNIHDKRNSASRRTLFCEDCMHPGEVDVCAVCIAARGMTADEALVSARVRNEQFAVRIANYRILVLAGAYNLRPLTELLADDAVLAVQRIHRSDP